MYNVLHVIGYFGLGGDTTVVKELMGCMDRSKYHFDFVTHAGHPEMKMEPVEEMRSSGSKVYFLDGDVRQLGIRTYYQRFLELLRQSDVKYDAIHVHTGMQSGVALTAAKKAGIPVRICHSHVTSIQRSASLLKKILAVPVFRYLYMKNSTQKAACSKDAGRFLFGDNSDFALIYNAVDIEPYLDIAPKQTEAVRSSLGIGEDDIVIGHIARMSPMKNQRFIVELAKRMTDQPKIKFVLVGNGYDFEEIQAMAKDLPNVILTGWRTDIPILMRMFDCAILPSLPGEGFPMTMIEAQAAGCRCLISEHVTKEVEVGLQLVKTIPLTDPDAWVRELGAVTRNTDHEQRAANARRLMDMGFSRKQFAEKWLQLYI